MSIYIVYKKRTSYYETPTPIRPAHRQQRKRLLNDSRAEARFWQIIEHIKTESPAAVVIAGDVYDRAIPSIEAVRVFDDFLTELARLDVAVLLVSGNHDSPERISYASRLLSDRRIYFYCAYDGSMHKVVLPDEYGDINFWLLPFIKPAMVRNMFGEVENESYDDIIADGYEKAKKRAARGEISLYKVKPLDDEMQKAITNHTSA